MTSLPDLPDGSVTDASVIIVGAGFLGSELARSLHANPLEAHFGGRVLCTTRSSRSAEALRRRGWAAIALDHADYDSLGPWVRGVECVVYCAAPRDSSHREAVYARGPQRWVEEMPSEAHLILVSSTGVYAERGGAWVDETAPLSTSERAQPLRIGEQGVLAAGATVLRLGGLVGAQRGPHRRPLLHGPLSDRWLNLVWHTDVVAVLRWALRVRPGGVFNVSGPVQRRREFYEARPRARGEAPLVWRDDGDQGYRVDCTKLRKASHLEPSKVEASLLWKGE